MIRNYYESYNPSLLVFESYMTSIWAAVITMTTVGYGDVFAVSPYGRIISIANALWGMTLISLFATTLSGFIELNENQKKAIAEITNTKKSA